MGHKRSGRTAIGLLFSTVALVLWGLTAMCDKQNAEKQPIPRGMVRIQVEDGVHVSIPPDVEDLDFSPLTTGIKDVPPGEHSFFVWLDNTDAVCFSVDLEAGHYYKIHHHIKDDQDGVYSASFPIEDFPTGKTIWESPLTPAAASREYSRLKAQWITPFHPKAD